MNTFKQRHGRPKPPAKIWGGGDPREDCELANPRVVSVYYSRWMERWEVAMNNEICSFPTHAEAIAYAHNIAYQ